MIVVRPATDEDFIAFYAVRPPPIWFGMVALDGDTPIAFGEVVWDGEGKAWVGFTKAARETVSVVTMHRTAVRTMDILRQAGEKIFHAQCNYDIPGAEKWLHRLGFRPRADGSEVWVAS